MEQRCSNCMYSDLENDAAPCIDCLKSITSGGDRLYWLPEIEDITDPSEALRLILKNQTYIMLEIGRLRKDLDKFKE